MQPISSISGPFHTFCDIGRDSVVDDDELMLRMSGSCVSNVPRMADFLRSVDTAEAKEAYRAIVETTQNPRPPSRISRVTWSHCMSSNSVFRIFWSSVCIILPKPSGSRCSLRGEHLKRWISLGAQNEDLKRISVCREMRLQRRLVAFSREVQCLLSASSSAAPLNNGSLSNSNELNSMSLNSLKASLGRRLVVYLAFLCHFCIC